MLQMIIDRWLYEHPWDPFPDEIAVEQIPQEGNAFELGSVGKLYYTPTGTVVTAHVVSMAYDVLAGRVTSIGVNPPAEGRDRHYRRAGGEIRRKP